MARAAASTAAKTTPAKRGTAKTTAKRPARTPRAQAGPPPPPAGLPTPPTGGPPAPQGRGRGQSELDRLAEMDEPFSLDAVPEMLRFTTKDQPKAEDEVRVPLFSIDDKVYTVPADPDLSIGLEASDLMADRTVPPDIASTRSLVYLLYAMLGPAGWMALKRLRGLDGKAFWKIASICQQMAMGKLEVPKGGFTDD